MPSGPDGSDDHQPSSDRDFWLDDYSHRFARALDDSVRAGQASADRWILRSRADRDWTADSVTADVIAEWEEFTPLLGRWLDLGLEVVQRPWAGDGQELSGRRTRPTSVRDSSILGRANEYRTLAESAQAKFRASSYRSEDLVDDWFTVSAKAARDVTAAATFFWSRLTGPVSGGDEAPPAGG